MVSVQTGKCTGDCTNWGLVTVGVSQLTATVLLRKSPDLWPKHVFLLRPLFLAAMYTQTHNCTRAAVCVPVQSWNLEGVGVWGVPVIEDGDIKKPEGKDVKWIDVL